MKCPHCHQQIQRTKGNPIAQIVAGNAPEAQAPLLFHSWRVARALLTEDWQRRCDLVPIVAALAGCAESTVENLFIEAARQGAIESRHDKSSRRRVLLRLAQTGAMQ